MATEALRGTAEDERRRHGWRSPAESLGEYGRGLAGGLIFSLPVLYTQEVWQLGAAMSPARLGAGLLGTLLLLLGYNRYAGLRDDASPAEVFIDSVEELGLGLLVAALVLWLVGALRADMRADALVSVVLLSGMLAGIGVSVGTAQLGVGGADSGAGGDEGRPGLLGQAVLGTCGAVLIAANIAPTEEVMRIAAAVEGPRLLGLVALSLAITATICLFSDFRGAADRGRMGPLDLVAEVTVSYGTALAVAAAMLWFFGRLGDLAPISAVARVIVLGVPAALGASAGRLLLQGQAGQ